MKIDQLIRSRRKTIALIVEADGRLIVRAPLRTSQKQIESLVVQKIDWIRSKQEQARKTRSAPPQSYVDGSTFLYLGKAYPLTLVEHQRPALVFDRHFYLDRSNLPRAQAVFTAWYREQARGVLEQRVAWCARQYGLAAKGVRITSARTRWGSCSSRGTLNFTWRLVMAPLEIIDYVVIHELAHLKEKNHSPAFWQLVERMLPDFRWRRDWLKKNGHILAL